MSQNFTSIILSFLRWYPCLTKEQFSESPQHEKWCYCHIIPCLILTKLVILWKQPVILCHNTVSTICCFISSQRQLDPSSTYCSLLQPLPTPQTPPPPFPTLTIHFFCKKKLHYVLFMINFKQLFKVAPHFKIIATSMYTGQGGGGWGVICTPSSLWFDNNIVNVVHVQLYFVF